MEWATIEYMSGTVAFFLSERFEKNGDFSRQTTDRTIVGILIRCDVNRIKHFSLSISDIMSISENVIKHDICLNIANGAWFSHPKLTSIFLNFKKKWSFLSFSYSIFPKHSIRSLISHRSNVHRCNGMTAKVLAKVADSIGPNSIGLQKIEKDFICKNIHLKKIQKWFIMNMNWKKFINCKSNSHSIRIPSVEYLLVAI